MSTHVKSVERDGFAHRTGRTSEQLMEQPSVPVEILPRHRWYILLRAFVDPLLAVLLLIPCLPVILLAALAIKLTSRGPAFYSQTRVGLRGIEFKIYKLRTMLDNAEALTGAVWSSANDPRITPLGKLLRELHIDEFPQLFNVLFGQMSLVGPRPERPEFVNSLEWQLPEYRQRLAVRPGVTGLAQLNLPPDSDLESVRKKLVHDIYYIYYCSPWLDTKILYSTAWLLFQGICTWLVRGFLVPDKDQVEREIARLVDTESQLLVEATQPVEPRTKPTQIVSIVTAED